MSRIDKVSAEQAEAIRQLFANGHTVTDIAKMSGRCTRTVGYIVETRKQPPPRKREREVISEPPRERIGLPEPRKPTRWPDGWSMPAIPLERMMAGR